jgi:uncharacterized membrane protein YidH (DUF202 family)
VGYYRGLMEEEPLEGVVDATRRTHLASERTYLAWWRSALAAFAVSLGVGKIVPRLTGGSAIGYEVLGVGYGLLGIALIGYGFRRQQQIEAALREGRFPPFERTAAFTFTIAGIFLGAGTIVAVVA